MPENIQATGTRQMRVGQFSWVQPPRTWGEKVPKHDLLSNIRCFKLPVNLIIRSMIEEVVVLAQHVEFCRGHRRNWRSVFILCNFLPCNSRIVKET